MNGFCRFNVYCVLGLSCLSISFAVCSLPFIIDLMSFYLISLTLGIGLGLSYNGKTNKISSRITLKYFVVYFRDRRTL